jgi:hypothetical protein
MLHQFGKFYQWDHLAPPGLWDYRNFTTLGCCWLDYSVVKVLQKSSYESEFCIQRSKQMEYSTLLKRRLLQTGFVTLIALTTFIVGIQQA